MISSYDDQVILHPEYRREMVETGKFVSQYARVTCPKAFSSKRQRRGISRVC